MYMNSWYVLLSIYDIEKRIKALYLVYGMEDSNVMDVLLDFVSFFCYCSEDDTDAEVNPVFSGN